LTTISNDGHVRSNGSREGNDFLATYDRVCRERSQRQSDWVFRMRCLGVAIITPDDGWVDRQRHTVAPPSYANLVERAAVGDLIALGNFERWRIVQITRVEERWLRGTLYHFDPSELDVTRVADPANNRIITTVARKAAQQ